MACARGKLNGVLCGSGGVQDVMKGYTALRHTTILFVCSVYQLVGLVLYSMQRNKNIRCLGWYCIVLFWFGLVWFGALA